MLRRLAVLAFAAAFASFALVSPALAAPGDLDASFGSGGIVHTDATASSDVGLAAALLPDGRIIVCGAGATGFLLTRYLPNGAVDTNFGVNGFTQTAFTGSGAAARSIAIQPDGRIVVAGDCFASPNFFSAVARYDSSGTLDPSFGTNGKVLQAIGTVGSVNAVALQSDGKVVICGGFRVSGTTTFVGLRRYNTNGGVDSTFGFNGTVTRGPGIDNEGFDLAVQPDGKLVVAGRTQLTTNDDQILTFRFKTNGTPDSTFGTVGRVITSVSVFREFGKAIVLLPGGRILVGGHVGVPGNTTHQFVALRFTASGALDAGFGSGGVALTPEVGITTGNSFLQDMLVEPNGKIVLTGQATNLGTSDDFAIARMDSAGAMDASFGSGGFVYTDIGGDSRDISFAILRQGDGKLVAVGQGGTGVFVGGPQVSLARYEGDPSTADAPGLTDRSPDVVFAPATPNPFGTTTRLSYRLPVAAHVTLDVYDLHGRRIARLVEDEESAGTHSLTWNGAGPGANAGTSAVYFARLSVRSARGVESRTIKLLRMR